MSDFARHHGHVIDALRAMGVASVQCIATSAPYFGLRDYGLEPVIWAQGKNPWRALLGFRQ